MHRSYQPGCKMYAQNTKQNVFLINLKEKHINRMT